MVLLLAVTELGLPPGLALLGAPLVLASRPGLSAPAPVGAGAAFSEASVGLAPAIVAFFAGSALLRDCEA